MKARGWIGCMLVAGLLWSGLAVAEERTVDVGGRAIVVPVEQGYELISDNPVFMEALAKFLPLGHLNEGMLDLMVRGKGPEAALLPAAVLVGFAVAFAGLAVAMFRWED